MDKLKLIFSIKFLKLLVIAVINIFFRVMTVMCITLGFIQFLVVGIDNVEIRIYSYIYLVMLIIYGFKKLKDLNKDKKEVTK